MLPQISIANGGAISVDEAAGTAFVSIAANSSIPPGETVTVSYEIEGVSATAGADFDLAGGTLSGNVYTASASIAGGSADVQIPVGILQDALDEADETLVFRILSVSPNATLGAVTETTVTILDDDAPTAEPVTVSLASGALSLGEGAGTASVTIETDGTVPDGEPITVSFEIEGGTATAGTDFSFAGGTFSGGVYTATAVVAGGTASVDVPVSILQDADDEADETFVLRLLSAGPNAVLGGVTETTVTILDDDEAPVDPGEALYRVNAGGGQVAANDGGIAWSADTTAANSPYLVSAGSNNTAGSYAGAGATGLPEQVFDTERWDKPGATTMQWGFAVADGTYQVNLYVGNGYSGTNTAGARVFDVAVEGSVPASFDDVDPVALFGDGTGGLLTATVQVTDGTLNLEFLHGVENPQVNAIEILSSGGGTVATGPSEPEGPSDPPDLSGATTASDVFAAAAASVDDDGDYAAGDTGAGLLSITSGIQNIQRSNYGAGSFQLRNTGDKDIAAVVLDFRSSLFGDAVIDPDGRGGDPAFKNFAVDAAGGTGGFIPLPEAYLFGQGSGAIPITIANSESGGLNGQTSNGGFKGLFLGFDGSSGGFEPGETITFSGDMDPNSIAGLNKNGTLGVDSSGWDSGGVSGAELVGSTFALLFDDGTTATGHLGSDGSFAGAVGEAVEDRAGASATLSVTTGSGTYGSGQSGLYGTEAPVIGVDGPANALVRVLLEKGVNTVNNAEAPSNVTATGSESIGALVQDRLETASPEFPANNAFDLQVFDIQLDGSGSAILPADAFDFVETATGVSFDGDAVQPLALVASVLGTSLDGGTEVPLGPVSEPVYLESEFATGDLIDQFFIA